MQRFSASLMLRESGRDRYFSVTTPLKKGPATTTLLFLCCLSLVSFLSYRFIHFNSSRFDINSANTTSSFYINSTNFTPALYINSTNTQTTISKKQENHVKIEFPLNCFERNQIQTCPSHYPKYYEPEPEDSKSPPECPEYFRWIHEDLRPWKETGITRDMVERAKATAHFRLVVLKGRIYVEKYKEGIDPPLDRSRVLFNLWGFVQLLRRYAGRLPDMELMFDCHDRPLIRARDYTGPDKPGPPPLFRYCGDRGTLDLVFPDWTFWGWADINIKPWEVLLKEIKEGNKRIKWMEREPYAYWKGNPFVAETRKDLLTCNASDKLDWNARIFVQDWGREAQQGFKQSDLANQCAHRYKIYIEGWAWSVSEKYILACDAVTLLVKPRYYDFFSRSLQPVHHYWPIRDNDKCRSIKFAVDWGNKHTRKAQEIGKAASNFMQEDLKMENVYDYMFHLVNEYAKLLRFKPKRPKGAIELCAETLVCPANGRPRSFMMDSLVKGPSVTGPCSLPPPHEPHAFRALVRRKFNSVKQVEMWEKKYWENINSTQQG